MTKTVLNNKVAHMIGEPAWLKRLRAKAWTDFTSMPDLSFKYGLNIFFPPQEIPFESYNPSMTQSEATISGPEGAIVLSFREAFQNAILAPLLNEHLTKRCQTTDKLSAWHDAVLKNGLLIYVPAKTELKEPFHINLILKEKMRVDHLLIIADPMSSITVIEDLTSIVGSGDRPFRSAVVDVVAGQNAKVTIVSAQHFGEDVVDFTRKRAWVGRDASVTWIDWCMGGAFAHSRITTHLEDEGASVKQRSAFFGIGEECFDLASNTTHFAPGTSSDIISKGALGGRAKTINRGLIRIENGAVRSRGFQKEDTLLLSENAEIDTVPILEINTDDVACGHGSTTGQVNKEQLFYLMSRGLDEAAATTAIVEGFFDVIAKDVPDKDLIATMTALIAGRLAKTI